MRIILVALWLMHVLFMRLDFCNMTQPNSLSSLRFPSVVTLNQYKTVIFYTEPLERNFQTSLPGKQKKNVCITSATGLATRNLISLCLLLNNPTASSRQVTAHSLIYQEQEELY
jgi:hypothetical protein